MVILKLFIGLGNPGEEYEDTRHNIGYNFLDYYLGYKGIESNWKKKNNGLYIKTSLYDEDVIFLKPLSYMNLSGGVVRKYIDYFKIDIEDIYVICDDLDLKVGNFKFRNRGSSGGHNGLKDIEKAIGSSTYKRIRIGIDNDVGVGGGIDVELLALRPNERNFSVADGEDNIIT